MIAYVQHLTQAKFWKTSLCFWKRRK